MSNEDSDDDEGPLPISSTPKTNQEMHKRQEMAMQKSRRAQWPEDVVDDEIDINCENESLKRKIIFTNNKSQKKQDAYEKALVFLGVHCWQRGEIFPFSLTQTRIKFKDCIAICWRVAMLCKTASGIENFIECKGHGQWLMRFYVLLKSRPRASQVRDSCHLLPERKMMIFILVILLLQ